METLYYCSWQSPVGPLTVVASEYGLMAVEFGSKPGSRRPAEGICWEESEERTRQYRTELEDYFLGEKKEFTFPLDLRGTEFQKRCWHALLEIPYGETRSYADIALAIGSPQAFRAVGMANNRNPIPIVVPCHRVIASDGSLCGYGGGMEIKEKLLRLERVWSAPEINAIA
ncbi:MAG: methylated-DNA--[protein]-cysteine S-methyltransferase [Candidatus Korobacteraceae bacterium]